MSVHVAEFRSLPMRIRRTLILSLVVLLAVPALASTAIAGGRVERYPLPGWLKIAIVVALLVVGALYVSVVAVGIAYRRRHQ
jgi:hypothetical protein